MQMNRNDYHPCLNFVQDNGHSVERTWARLWVNPPLALTEQVGRSMQRHERVSRGRLGGAADPCSDRLLVVMSLALEVSSPLSQR